MWLSEVEVADNAKKSGVSGCTVIQIRLKKLRPLPRPVSGHRAWCSRAFVAGEPGCRRQALVSMVLFEGALVGSVTSWPLRTTGGAAATGAKAAAEAESVAVADGAPL